MYLTKRAALALSRLVLASQLRVDLWHTVRMTHSELRRLVGGWASRDRIDSLEGWCTDALG